MEGSAESISSRPPSSTLVQEPVVQQSYGDKHNDYNEIVTGYGEASADPCCSNLSRSQISIHNSGALIVLRDVGVRGIFPVFVASENTKMIIGKTPDELFSLSSFLDVLAKDDADDFIERVTSAKERKADMTTHRPDVFLLDIRVVSGQPAKLCCALQVDSTDEKLILCEFEPETDCLPMSCPDQSRGTSRRPKGTNPIATRRRGNNGALRTLDFMSQVQNRLAATSDITAMLDVLVSIVTAATGSQCVTIYRSDGSTNGRKVDEMEDFMVDNATTETDPLPNIMPPQPRASYIPNEAESLHDCDSHIARLVYRPSFAPASCLDLTYCYLRVVSDTHVADLRDTTARSVLSISIGDRCRTWGFILCRSLAASGQRMSFPHRRICQFIADVAFVNIQRLTNVMRIQAWDDITAIFTRRSVSGCSVTPSEQLLRLFQADFGVLCVGGHVRMIGRLDRTQEPLIILQHLRTHKIHSALVSNNIQRDFPGFESLPGSRSIMGVLAVPMVQGHSDLFLFFRRCPPQNAFQNSALSKSEPNAYFGKVRRWSQKDVETANILCSVPVALVRAWAENEAPARISRLTQLLLDNSAHEVRTPLNAIVNYLELALQGELSNETRKCLLEATAMSRQLSHAVTRLLM